MRTRKELQDIKDFVDFSYTRFHNSLQVSLNKKFDKNNPELGYCFKYEGETATIYKIVVAPIGIERTDFRTMMHEYGHIYLGHLDGIHEELDGRILDTITNHRGELIDYINNSCGIDFADKLLERIIDDPYLNHSLHNIAMDFEVNTKVLSSEDVEEMESDISGKLDDYQTEYLKYLQDNAKDEATKKALQDEIDKLKGQSKIKLMLPERYHFPDGTPWPSGLTYPEYLMMIIKYMDQFIKMLVSIKKGGNGDTSGVSQQDVSNALKGQSQGGGQGGGMQSLDDLMRDCGMGGDSGQGQGQDQSGQGQGSDSDPVQSPYQGTRPGTGIEDTPDKDAGGRDHSTPERDETDEKRKLGQIRSTGGVGCGNGGGPGATRLVARDVDTVDTAIDEVLARFKTKVVKRTYTKDNLYNYNRGINRTVIAPTFLHKVSVSSDPTIVFLIDISGSMDTRLVDRILKTISLKMKKIKNGLKYNIITWSTELGEHIKNIDPKKPVPRISMGGGTRMAGGMQYFKDNYGPDAILILISDFEDYLEEWHKVEETMKGYTMYGFNYGSSRYNQKFTYFKVKNFTDRKYD
jgi:hypothetical protein